MKGSYQVVLTISDVEDVLEIAELLAPLKDIKQVKVSVATPRPEPRPQSTQPVASIGTPQLATAPQKPTQPSG